MTWTHEGTVSLPYMIGEEQDDRWAHHKERLFRSHDGELWIGENFIFNTATGNRLNGRGRLNLDTIQPIEVKQ